MLNYVSKAQIVVNQLRHRDIYLMLLYTGMSIGDLVNLEWDGVDFERRKNDQSVGFLKAKRK